MSVSVASVAGPAVEVSEAAFGCAFNEPLVHQAVVAYLAGGRSGSKAQKSRGDVRGGGRKPHRQKRTGRARAGSIRSPIWRGGGRTFAARPTNHAVKLNRKMYQGAIRCIFSELIRQDRLASFSPADLSLESPKTKTLAAKLGELGVGDVLIVVAEADADLAENLVKASGNLRGVDVCRATEVDPVSLIGHDKVLVAADALRAIEERLA